MAFWAFALGYLISSMIQVFVTRERMRNTMGKAGVRSVLLATFFGFISSSCSFSALSTTRALFTKGAGLVPSLAFLLSSTNLVIELGIVIAVFLGWQFVVGEYLGGILLILLTWLIVRLTLTKKVEQIARSHAKKLSSDEHGGTSEDISWKKRLLSKDAWQQVAKQYIMEWKMVWKDVAIGFTVAGIIAAFVPTEFFHSLFLGAGKESNTFFEILAQAILAPLAAFFTFIGSMGNIPLAALLFGQGVSFAGVMAFIFSDLIVFPVLRIQAKYYGWKIALYIMVVFLIALVSAALILHFGFAMFDLLPNPAEVKSISDRNYFKVDYGLFFNVGFIALSCFFFAWHWKKKQVQKTNRVWSDWTTLALSFGVITWLLIGVTIIPQLQN